MSMPLAHYLKDFSAPSTPAGVVGGDFGVADDLSFDSDFGGLPEPEPVDVLGGRVLGWVGGIAVAIAAIFFVVMAVHNGWIGVDARMALADVSIKH